MAFFYILAKEVLSSWGFFLPISTLSFFCAQFIRQLSGADVFCSLQCSVFQLSFGISCS